MIIDPRTPTMPGRGTSGFHQPWGGGGGPGHKTSDGMQLVGTTVVWEVKLGAEQQGIHVHTQKKGGGFCSIVFDSWI